VVDLINKQKFRYITPCTYGQHSAGWLSFYDYFNKIPETKNGTQPAQGLINIAKNSGWFWAFTDTIIISDRPVKLELDEQGRLHNPNGLAIEYADGWGIHALNGVTLTGGNERAIINPEELSAENVLSWENTEARRVVLHHIIGWEKTLEAMNAEVLDEVEGDARLLRVTLENDEPHHLMDMLNHTCDRCVEHIGACECDGGPVRKRYVEGVPVECSSVVEAHAWRWGLDELVLDQVVERA